MERLGLDNEHRSAYTPHGERPRVFDQPDLVAYVYNQFEHAVVHELEENSEEYFGENCIAIAAKLEFQERNKPHQNILLEGGVLQDLDQIDSIITAGLPRPGENDELRALVKRFDMHRHPQYCRGRTSNRRCRFGYYENTTREATFLGEVTNRVVYR